MGITRKSTAKFISKQMKVNTRIAGVLKSHKLLTHDCRTPTHSAAPPPLFPWDTVEFRVPNPVVNFVSVGVWTRWSVDNLIRNISSGTVVNSVFVGVYFIPKSELNKTLGWQYYCLVWAYFSKESTGPLSGNGFVMCQVIVYLYSFSACNALIPNSFFNVFMWFKY